METTTCPAETAKLKRRARLVHLMRRRACVSWKILQLLYSVLRDVPAERLSSATSAIWDIVEMELVPIADWTHAPGPNGCSNGHALSRRLDSED